MPDQQPPEHVPLPHVRLPAVEAIDLWKAYGHVQALRSASIAVHPREVVALVGDNGAGKSTLLKALSGAVIPDSGEIRIGTFRSGAVSVHEADIRGVQTVYQDLALAPALTVAENVFLGHEPVVSTFRRIGHLDRRLMRIRSRAALEELGIDLPSMDLKVRDLSGGQRQAVAIARAVIWARGAILLDEPTAALGVRQSETALEMIRKVAAAGLAVLIVSHDMPAMLGLAHRVAVMRHGAVVADLKTEGLSVQEIVAYMLGYEASSTAGPALNGPGAVSKASSPGE
jgi:simple sugar transport system ATP-binding protein